MENFCPYSNILYNSYNAQRVGTFCTHNQYLMTGHWGREMFCSKDSNFSLTTCCPIKNTMHNFFSVCLVYSLATWPILLSWCDRGRKFIKHLGFFGMHFTKWLFLLLVLDSVISNKSVWFYSKFMDHQTYTIISAFWLAECQFIPTVQKHEIWECKNLKLKMILTPF